MLTINKWQHPIYASIKKMESTRKLFVSITFRSFIKIKYSDVSKDSKLCSHYQQSQSVVQIILAKYSLNPSIHWALALQVVCDRELRDLPPSCLWPWFKDLPSQDHRFDFTSKWTGILNEYKLVEIRESWTRHRIIKKKTFPKDRFWKWVRLLCLGAY